MLDRLRVTMLIKNFPAGQGGAERQLEALAPLLAERGVDVTVVARRREGGASGSPGARVHHVDVSGARSLSAFQYVVGAVRFIARERPDVVHAHSLLSPATAALVARGVLGVPVVVKVLLGGKGGEVQRLREWRRGGRMRLAALRRGFDRFLVISEEIDAELEAAGVPADRRSFVPNGVDTDRFSPVEAADRERIRNELGLGPGPVVLVVGRLVPQKGMDVLLDAWATVHRSCPDARLVVLGDGPERRRLEERADASVAFFGRVDDVVPFLCAADVFALTSYAEGLSNALLEAMATASPIVATDVGATREVLGDAGRLTRPGDADDLAAALTDLLGDPAARRRLGDAARAKVIDGYRLIDTADRLVALYRSLLA